MTMKNEAFEKWAEENGYEVGPGLMAHNTFHAYCGYIARQPEIDALKQESVILQDYWNKAQRDLAKQQDEIYALQADFDKRMEAREKRTDLLDRINKDLLAEVERLRARNEVLESHHCFNNVTADAAIKERK